MQDQPAAQLPAEAQQELMGYVSSMQAAGMDDGTIATQLMRAALSQSDGATYTGNLKRLGVAPVGREFTNDKATDFSAILTRLKATKPDAIFYGGMDAQGAPLLRQMKQLGIDAKYLGGDGVCTTEMIKLAGPAIGADVFCTQAGIPMGKMPAGKSFNERFLKRFSTPVQLYAPYSYDAASALIEAMKLADSADPARYLPLLQKVSFKGVTGAANLDVSEVARRVAAIREHIQLPIGVGFGIRDAATAQAIGRAADAVVIGSRIIQLIEDQPHEKVVALTVDFLRGVRKALDA